MDTMDRMVNGPVPPAMPGQQGAQGQPGMQQPQVQVMGGQQPKKAA
jgi:hypothetical protein